MVYRLERGKSMTVYQEAHEKIDQLPEDTVYLFIQLMERMQDADRKQHAPKSKDKFLSTAGKINIDEQAVNHLREASMI